MLVLRHGLTSNDFARIARFIEENHVITPRTPPGTLELLPREQMTFQHMIDTIRRGYESFGFVPIETPVFEMKDVLLTKSGGETEKQVYFVQSTGSLQQGHEADLALRFDLTVPLARYVAEHERDLAFPFRRYQIQRVYRGERAQRGRFREFYQCDIDIIGKDKLSAGYDAEIPAIIAQIFEELNIGDFTIHFSNRKILLGLLAGYGVEDAEKQKLILREIDKLDKIGAGKVQEGMVALGLSDADAGKLLKLISFKGDNDHALALLREQNAHHPIFQEGLGEITQVVEVLNTLNVRRARINLAIARGLDYYTGTVYETLIDAHPEFGSVCSGGRYDDLAGYYTRSKLPGVGMSIGLTRLYDQMQAQNLLQRAPNTVQVMVAQLDPQLDQIGLVQAQKLRAAGLNVESYWESAKLDKKIRYADKAGIPILVLLGMNEHASGKAIVKDLGAKTQYEVGYDDLDKKIRELLS